MIPKGGDMDTWRVIEVDQLDRLNVTALLSNSIAAIRVPRLLEEEACRASASSLLAHGFDYYENCEPPMGRIGITQYEHYLDKSGYLQKAPAATAVRRRCLMDLPDPLSIVIDQLSAIWRAPVGVANESGMDYFAGLFRAVSGAQLHADWGPRDGPDWVIGKVTAQLAWNLYYRAPALGGDLILYNRPWSPEVEQTARQRFNDYDPAVVAGRRVHHLHPETGDLIIFNARNVHGVTEASGSVEDRLSVSSFVGRLPDDSLVLWS
jgi:hypothetical protein